MSRLQDVIARGTLAGQPAANAVPIGELYCITDKSFTVQQSDGTSWLPFSGATAAGITTITTTGNIVDLDFANAPVLRMNNATLATLQGLKAGTDGQELTIISVGAGQVNLSHQDAGDATAANRLLNMVTSGVTPLAAGVGSARLKYDATTARWRLANHEQGDYVAVPFSAGNYTGQGAMTWTVIAANQLEYTFYLKGRQMTVNISTDSTTIAGTPNQFLQVTLPNGYTINSANARMNCRIHDNGTFASGGEIIVSSVFSTTLLLFAKDGTGATNWVAGTTNCGVFGTLSFPIN